MRARILLLAIVLLAVVFISHSAMATSTPCRKPYHQIILQDTVGACMTLARAGNPNAQYHLGLLLFFGDGVPDNVTKSLSWLTKAATQGHIRAQRMLGLVYSHGLGVNKRMDLAKRWYSVAAKEGSIEAEISLLKIRSHEILSDVAATGEGLLMASRGAWRSVFNTIIAFASSEEALPIVALEREDRKGWIPNAAAAGDTGIP